MDLHNSPPLPSECAEGNRHHAMFMVTANTLDFCYMNLFQNYVCSQNHDMPSLFLCPDSSLTPMALCTFGAGFVKINLSPPTSIEGAGPTRARASTGCCWGPNGISSSPTSQWFRRAESESRNNGRALHKIYLQRVPPLGRTIICDCGVREFFYGDSGGNRGGNSGGNGDGNGDDGAFNGSNPFGNILIIYCQMRSRDKLAVNRALFCLLMAGCLWQHQLFFAIAKTDGTVSKSAAQIVHEQHGNAAPSARLGMSRRVYPLVSHNPYQGNNGICIRQGKIGPGNTH